MGWNLAKQSRRPGFSQRAGSHSELRSKDNENQYWFRERGFANAGVSERLFVFWNGHTPKCCMSTSATATWICGKRERHTGAHVPSALEGWNQRPSAITPREGPTVPYDLAVFRWQPRRGHAPPFHGSYLACGGMCQSPVAVKTFILFTAASDFYLTAASDWILLPQVMGEPLSISTWCCIQKPFFFSGLGRWNGAITFSYVQTYLHTGLLLLRKNLSSYSICPPSWRYVICTKLALVPLFFLIILTSLAFAHMLSAMFEKKSVVLA